MATHGNVRKINATIDNHAKINRPVDFSFMNLMLPRDMLNEMPRGIKEPKEGEKYKSKCLRLNNNHITELTDFMDVVTQAIAQPYAISWIDLSFNELTKINDVLCEFPNLQILYLHGNLIADLSEVDKLRDVQTLKKLAMHGNPMENVKNYRWYVLALIPQLVNFDMSTVSRNDRAAADSYRHALEVAEKRKKPKYEDDDY